MQYVYGMDGTGRILSMMTQKQAENAVVKGRARWVSYNVVQFLKAFERPDESIIKNLTKDDVLPLPGAARPELVRDVPQRVVENVATDPTGEFAEDTMELCWELAREAATRRDTTRTDDEDNDDARTKLARAANATRTQYGERFVVRGSGAGPDRRPMERIAEYQWDEKARRHKTVTHKCKYYMTSPDGSQEEFIPEKTKSLPRRVHYTNDDIGKGLQGNRRKRARKIAFRQLDVIRKELIPLLELDWWDSQIAQNRYMERNEFIGHIEKIIVFLLVIDESKFRAYRKRYKAIIRDSQAVPTPTIQAI